MDEHALRALARAWRDADPDPATAAQIDTLLHDGAPAELREHFGQSLAFGTAGLRGLLGPGPNRMNRAVIRRATSGFASYLGQSLPDARGRGVVVAYDARHQSDVFAADVAGVLTAAGFVAWVFASYVPTPVAAFACRALGAAGAVVVTASHNPPAYNGYKVYWENGAQIIPPHDDGIARAMAEAGPAKDIALLEVSAARAALLLRDVPESIERDYLGAVLAARPRPASPASPVALKVVHTSLHGVGGRFIEAAFREAGIGPLIQVVEQAAPDPDFPTVRFPNPEEDGALDLARALALERGADVVLANDPDADRLAAVVPTRSGEWAALTGDELGALLGHYLLTHLPPAVERPLVIATVVSSGLLRQIAADLGARYDETLTGFKWIANRALAREREDGSQFVFGYEEALGYCIGTAVRDKDGISAAVVFADLVAECRAEGRFVHDYLDDIYRRHGLFRSRAVSVWLQGADGMATMQARLSALRERPPDALAGRRVVAVADYLRGVRRTKEGEAALDLPRADMVSLALEGGARVTVRPSGTEPKLKYYFEHREDVAAAEPVVSARRRAEAALDALAEAVGYA